MSATEQPAFTPTDYSRVRRLPQRAAYDKASVYAIVDAVPICHVGLVEDGRPVVIPTIHARMGDTIVLHGARASRLLKHAAAGHELCITVTQLDGLVLARSVFHHSMNYQSAVIFGRGTIIEDPAAKMAALEAITDHVMPGRWSDARLPNTKEMNATSVVAVAIETATAKVRVGPPSDDEEDYARPIWAGVVPLHLAAGQPEDDPRLTAGIPTPEYVTNYVAEHAK